MVKADNRLLIHIALSKELLVHQATQPKDMKSFMKRGKTMGFIRSKANRKAANAFATIFLTALFALILCVFPAVNHETAFAKNYNPGKASSVKLSKVDYSFVKVTWKKAKHARSYQVAYRDKAKKSWSYASSKKNAYKAKNLSQNTYYQFKVRATSGKKKGKWSPTRAFATKAKQPQTITTLDTTSTENGLAIKWAKCRYANRYQLAYKTNSSNSWNYRTTKDTELFLDGLTKGGKYQTKIRPINKGAVSKYGTWSKTAQTSIQANNEGGNTKPSPSPSQTKDVYYTVTFVVPDIDGASLSEPSLRVQRVKKGEDAKPPTITFKNGDYKFDGWSQSVKNVSRDMKVSAKYSKQVYHTVTFVVPDFGGASLSDPSLRVQKVKDGEDAKAPTVNFKEPSLKFKEWWQRYTNVKSDVCVYARYTKTPYSYEVYSLTGKTLYSIPPASKYDCDSGLECRQQDSYAFYFKTDNPGVLQRIYDGSSELRNDIVLEAYDEKGNSVIKNEGFMNWEYNGKGTLNGNYSDIKYTDLGAQKVRGGFVIPLKFTKPGDFTVKIMEQGYSAGRLQYSVEAGSFKVHVEDFETAERKWMDSVINKYTKSNMTPDEKLRAIAGGLEKDFRYPTHFKPEAARSYIYLTKDGGTYFQNMIWDSQVSPTILCKIAERIGGFDKIENLYHSGDWSLHHLCRATYKGKPSTYWACPDLDSGLVSLTSLTKNDLRSTGGLQKLS